VDDGDGHVLRYQRPIFADIDVEDDARLSMLRRRVDYVDEEAQHYQYG
jgi:hypothetical protein